MCGWVDGWKFGLIFVCTESLSYILASLRKIGNVNEESLVEFLSVSTVIEEGTTKLGGASNVKLSIDFGMQAIVIFSQCSLYTLKP